MHALALQTTDEESPQITIRSADEILRRRCRPAPVAPPAPCQDPDPAAAAFWHAVKDLTRPARAAGVSLRALGEEERVDAAGRRIMAVHLDVGGVQLKIEATL